MSRWKSPQAVAKRAEREARKSELVRKEKRKSWILLACIIVMMIGGLVADWIWIKVKARERHKNHHHQGVHTNEPASPQKSNAEL